MLLHDGNRLSHIISLEIYYQQNKCSKQRKTLTHVETVTSSSPLLIKPISFLLSLSSIYLNWQLAFSWPNSLPFSFVCCSFGADITCVEIADSLQDGLVCFVLKVSCIRRIALSECFLNRFNDFVTLIVIESVVFISAHGLHKSDKLLTCEFQIELKFGEAWYFSHKSFCWESILEKTKYKSALLGRWIKCLTLELTVPSGSVDL